MSYRQLLLTQAEPLEPHEVEELRAWLKTLEADCDSFGETPEDVERMSRIKARIAKEQA